MTIAFKLKVVALVPAVLAAVVFLVDSAAYRSIARLEQEAQTVRRIGEAVEDLNELAQSYVQRHDDRPRRQFRIRYYETAALLAAARFEYPEHQRLAKDLAANIGVIKSLFDRLLANYERHRTVRNEALLAEAESRLVGQLTIRSHIANADASRLVTLAGRAILTRQKQAHTLILSAVAIAAIPLTLVLLGLTRRIASSLGKLRDGARVVGAGGLDHRIGLSSHDEIGALAREFDQMSEKLQATTVSRDALAAEVAERRRAEEQSRHLASFPQLNPNPVLEADLAGRVTYFNPAAQGVLERFGLDPGEIGLFCPADLGDIVRNAAGGGDPAHYRTVRIGDRVFGATVQVVPQFDVVRLYAYDVTDRARAEEELRATKDGLELRVAERTRELLESEARFRTVVESSPVGVLIVQDGRIVFRNPEHERIFGPLPDGAGLDDIGRVHPDDEAGARTLREAASAGRKTAIDTDLRYLQVRGAAEHGDMVWLNVRTVPIDYSGRSATLVTMADVTRARELEELVRVREKMAALGNISAGIAHEIRNPLSGINIYVSMIEGLVRSSPGLSPEEIGTACGFLAQVKSACDRISSVIERIMGFAKPVTPRLEPVDLNVAIEESLRLTAADLRDRRITVRKALDPALPRCLADLRLIEQVIMNLLSNAAHAMDSADGPRFVEVASAVEDGNVVVLIGDSGPGIPAHARKKIFEPFFTTRRDGYGIGLSFSHRVVADHGGSLTAGVSGWGGAEFRIAIPAEPAQGLKS